MSSIIIPMAAGIPLTITGILYWVMEHSILGVLIVALGAAAILTGIFSLLDFIRYKREKKIKKQVPKAR